MFESLDEIRTFVRVVDEKSLSAAARVLRVSVNAVWRRLERIEERAGARLVERTTRTLRVTPAGERLAKRARKILEELEGAESDIAAPEETLRGVVRVALAADVARRQFLLDVGELVRDNPELHVELIGRSRLIEPVAAGVDVILWVGPVKAQTATVRKLGFIDWALAAAPSYVARRGAPATLEQLSEHDCLLALQSARETTWTLVDREGREHKVPVQGRFEADTPGILLGALHGGLGIGLRPRYEVIEGARRGELVHVLPDYGQKPMEVSLVSPPGRLRVPAVRAVADALTREIHRIAGKG